MAKRIRSILIANRGEIACRIIRTCKRLGITSVALASDADKEALHAKRADKVISIASYLDADAVIAAAKKARVDAIHPGYGFLSENADFARKVEKAMLLFIGPSSRSIKAVGDKLAAKSLAHKLNIPTAPSFQWKGESPKKIERWARNVGYPLMIKASLGGGGRGLRKVESPHDLTEALAAASREAEKHFAASDIFVEKLISPARHVEVQLLGDMHGNVRALSDRDCSLQRRNQKIIEEAPASLSPGLRTKLHQAAEHLGKAVRYANAGTVEFLVSGASYYFLEINSRLQVEHPVTESVTGLDLVEIQIRIAEGALLEDLLPSKKVLSETQGHALEARLCAEIPEADFIPSTGPLERLIFPDDARIRIDTGVSEHDSISPHYDSLIAKVITHGENREEARLLLLEALRNITLTGVRTNLNFLIRLLESREFRKNTHDLRSAMATLPSPEELLEVRTDAASRFVQAEGPPHEGPWRHKFRVIPISVSQEFMADGAPVKASRDAILPEDIHAQRIDDEWMKTKHGIFRIVSKSMRASSTGAAKSSGSVTSPLPGKVIEIKTTVGKKVEAGETLLIIESMKMEHLIVAPQDGYVEKILVKPGEAISSGMVVVELRGREQ